MKSAVYARVSTTSDEQQNALEQQLERLRHAAPGAQEFIEIQSGTRTDRPVWEQLMAAAKAGTINRVVCTRLDRISRSRVHGARILQFFMQPSSPTLVALDDSLDLATPGGRFMAGLLINWSAAESERLGERTAFGHARRRALGKPFGPKPPFGFVWNDDRSNYLLDPANTDAARDIIDFFASGHGGLRATVRHASERHGVKFSGQSSLKRWLLNPSLCGFRVYGVSTVSVDEDGNKTRRHNRPGVYSEVHPDAHPALIEEVLHAKIVTMFEAPRDQALMPLRDNRVRVATGLGLCSHCHRRLHIHLSGKKRWYRCGNDNCAMRYRNRVPEQQILDAACLRMQELSTQLANQAIAVDIEANHPPSTEVQALQDEIATLEGTRLDSVKPLIEEAKRKLRLLLLKEERRSNLDVEAIERFFASEEGWRAMLRETPAELRQLLLANVAAVMTRDCTIEVVVLAADLEGLC